MIPTRSLVFGAVVFATPLLSGGAQGSELPFRVLTYDWTPEVKERQRRAYNSEAAKAEVLFCVEAWRTREIEPGHDMVEITAVRRDEAGGKHRIGNVGERCLDSNGKPLPMFHTHSDGNCQFSPADLVSIAARQAAFEGVQCGERHFIWMSAWEVVALYNAAQREQFARASRPP